MFQLFGIKKNKNPEPTFELVIDGPIYKKLTNSAHGEGISENDAMVYALKRGMRDYWLHVIKHESERYQLVKKLCEQSKQDNELLEAIIAMNDRFNKMLKDKEKQENI